jgi:hypothetical protein
MQETNFGTVTEEGLEHYSGCLLPTSYIGQKADTNLRFAVSDVAESNGRRPTS